MKTATATADTAAFNLAEELWGSMQAGVAPWQKMWASGAAPGRPMNVTSGKEYRSGNSLHLMIMSIKNGWSNKWISFVETNKLGGSLKGQKATKIETPVLKKDVDKTTGQETQVLRGFRTACVFNVSQVQGVEFESEGEGEAKPALNLIESVDSVERMLTSLKSQGLSYVEPSYNAGCWYMPSEDKIGMPNRGTFTNGYEFYSSLAHEMAHATRKEGRVNREKISYAFEELRAEIAATLICCTLSLPRTQAQVDNHAAYLQHWLEEFAEQKSMLLKAASEAQAIHDYLISLSK